MFVLFVKKPGCLTAISGIRRLQEPGLRGDLAHHVGVVVVADKARVGFTRSFVDLQRASGIHIEGGDADLDGEAVLHPNVPLAQGVVESVYSAGLAIDVAAAAAVLGAVTVVPEETCDSL